MGLFNFVFDEIEKAHPSLLNEMMLSFLDDNGGFVSDKKDVSQKYATADAIFVLTSNCFAEEISQAASQGMNEEAISVRIQELMKQQPDTRTSRCAWFAKEEVARRMKSGHAFANLQRFGFVVFLPPPVHVAEDMVTQFLLDYSRSYPGVFAWTPAAEVALRRATREKYVATRHSGGLSEVGSYLTGMLIHAMREGLQSCVVNLVRRDVLLYAR
jgi:hypothetical protein